MRNIEPEFKLGEDAVLRFLKLQDVTEAYVDGLNDPIVNRYMEIGKGKKQTINMVCDYVLEQERRNDAFLFGLFIWGKLRGTCRIHNISSKDADIGIALFDRSIWGRGWGTKIVSVVSQYTFQIYPCSQLKAGIAIDNVASKKVFENAGFRLSEVYEKMDPRYPGELWILDRKEIEI
jgi:ribosomal-protein-alanine N-acetyltransferase